MDKLIAKLKFDVLLSENISKIERKNKNTLILDLKYLTVNKLFITECRSEKKSFRGQLKYLSSKDNKYYSKGSNFVFLLDDYSSIIYEELTSYEKDKDTIITEKLKDNYLDYIEDYGDSEDDDNIYEIDCKNCGIKCIKIVNNFTTRYSIEYEQGFTKQNGEQQEPILDKTNFDDFIDNCLDNIFTEAINKTKSKQMLQKLEKELKHDCIEKYGIFSDDYDSRQFVNIIIHSTELYILRLLYHKNEWLIQYQYSDNCDGNDIETKSFKVDEDKIQENIVKLIEDNYTEKYQMYIDIKNTKRDYIEKVVYEKIYQDSIFIKGIRYDISWCYPRQQYKFINYSTKTNEFLFTDVQDLFQKMDVKFKKEIELVVSKENMKFEKLDNGSIVIVLKNKEDISKFNEQIVL